MRNRPYRIDVENISFVRDSRRILDGVTWKVRPGEHWAILGANGSGKTTLLNLATGYLWPTDGAVCVLGRRFGSVDLRQLRRRIGFVSSSLGSMIHGEQSSRKIVLSGAFGSMALFDATTAAQRRRADGLLEQVGCARLAESAFGTLSLGEQQRVLLARALMARPKLLILDEACAGLDIPSRESVVKIIGDFAEQENGPSILLVTHHVEEIPPAISHALVLRDGRVLAQGRKDKVLVAAVLERAFSVRLEVQRRYGRYWPHVIGVRREKKLPS